MLAGQDVSGDETVPRRIFDTQAFLQTVEGWRLSGWVYKRSLDLPGLLPRAVSEKTASRYGHNVRANLQRISELDRVEDEFRSRDIQSLIVKGIALISEIYRDPGVRTMSDIDMIVRPEREAEAVEVLRAQGYAQDAHHPTVFTSGEITIDLKPESFGVDRIRARGDAFSSVVPTLWLKCKPLRARGWYQTWNAAAQLYTLCVHGLKHGLPDGMWLTDIGESLKMMSAKAWEEAVDFFRLAANRDVLVLALIRVQDFGYLLPGPAAAWLKHQPISGRIRITIDLSRDPATSFLAESAYLASKQKGPVDAVRYIRQAVFPNKAIYEQSPIPDHLSTLRPAHRIIQVTIQVVRTIIARRL